MTSSARQPAPTSGPTWLERPMPLPARLAEELQAGGLTLICSRCSRTAGTRARDSAVSGAYAAASMLALRYGLDLRPLLPDKRELLALLEVHVQDVTSHSADGKQFKNYSYEYTDRARDGLVVLVQYGTGVTIDEHYHQPAIDRAARAIRTRKPALVYANEYRGWGRADFELGPLSFALDGISRERGAPVHVGAVKRPIRPWSNEVKKDLFEDGQRAKEEAEAIYLRTRIGYRERTDSGDVGDRFAYALGGALPPPLASARLLDDNGAPGEVVAFLDTPSCRPGANELADPRTVPTGRADQVELIRWFWEHAFTPEFPTRRAIAEYLVKHGYSTDGARRQHPGNPLAHPALRPGSAGRGDPAKLIAGILRARSFHLTGRLRLKVGDGSPDIEVRITPPDGRPLCTPEQDARVAASIDRLRSMRSPGHVHTFAGHPVTIDGVAARLAPEGRRHEAGTAYVCQRERSSPDAPRRRYTPAPPLRHTTLATAIVTAMTGPTALSPATHVAPSRRSELEAAETAAAAERQAALNAVAAAEERVGRQQSSHSWQLTLRLLDGAHAELDAANAAVEQARDALAALDQATDASGLALDDLLDFAASLRDPTASRHRALLRRDLTNFTLSTHRDAGPRDQAATALRFAFDLRLRDTDGNPWTLHVTGEQAPIRRSTLLTRLQRIIDELRLGKTREQAAGRGYRETAPFIRAALGHPPGTASVLFNVRDPRLKRLGMALMHPPPARPVRTDSWSGTTPSDVPRLVGPPLRVSKVRALSVATGEPVALLRHLQRVYSSPRGRTGKWLLDRAPRLVQLLAEAGKRPLPASDFPRDLRGRLPPGSLEFRNGHLRTAPCPFCGSRRRARPLIPEMIGLVCLRCRRDTAGHVWPGRAYNQYLDIPPRSRRRRA